MDKKKVISDFPKSFYKGKKVFVRVDFNVPINIETDSIREDYRIRRALPTIDFLIDAGAKIILGSHLGRPKGKVVKDLSLQIVSNRLSELIDKEVLFVEDFIGGGLSKQLDDLPNGSVVMLENLRFHEAETENDPAFSIELAKLADVYINEAFGTSHRAHCSTYGMTKDFVDKISGFLVDKELSFVSKMMETPEHPFLVIIGGSKIKDKISALGNLLDRADKIIVGGGAAYTFLKAQNINIGNSIYEKEMLSWVEDVYAKYKDKIVLPIDHVISKDFNKTSQCLISDIEIPDDHMALDIGPKTIELFNSVIKGPGYIFWNGPMGVFEFDQYSSGTIHVARAVALATWRGATSVVGGGETIAAIRKAEVLESEISHMSTGGGALLEYLGGSSLPGIEILD
ncbi:phosphoglycerate kinase [bacterium]|nr:phosphoglycerate kinase [bacterium]MBT3794962.1 phosphoglycerate kinase [bacterium]MBT4634922.1 phosphoglycerate kinase [bacterium]